MRFAPASTSRTDRNADRTSNRSSDARKNKRRPLGYAAKSVVETLESRQMLANVTAGQIGVFQGANGQPVRINITGSGGSLDFIGATRDELGNPQLNDIPMTIFDSSGNVVREILGGYAGRKGIGLADEILNDGVGTSEFTGPDSPYDNVPSGRVNLDGLAANNLGRTYGVNRYLDNGNTVIDVLRVDSRQGSVAIDSDVTQQVLDQLQLANPLFEGRDLLSVIGADFPPDDANTLYFALNVNYPTDSGGPNGTITRTPVPAMFTYDINTKQITLDANFFGFQQPTDVIRIDDFSFMDDGRIAMFGSIQQGVGTTPDVGLFFSDADAVIPDNFTPVRVGEQLPGQQPPPLTLSLAAIEVIPGETYMIAVTRADPAGGADDAQLIRVDLTTGRGRVIGPVVNPDEPSATVNRLGENIRDLTWNSRVYDHYFQPGKRGVLLGAESSRDVLVVLDARDRFPNSDLYAIYGNNVRSDLKAVVANFTLDADTDLSFNTRLFRGIMDPYGGNGGVVRTNMTPGQPTNLALGSTGGLYIGLRTRDITQAISVPVLSLDSRTDIAGSKPGVTLPRTVRPGVYINGTIDSLLVGGTITGAVNISGSIDTLYAGNILTGDPLSGQEFQTDNFFVGGDMRNLLVSGGIGTLAAATDRFAPGTDFAIGGRVQQIKSGLALRGSIEVVGRTSEVTVGDSLTELEYTPDQRTQNRAALAFEGRIDGSTYAGGGTLGLVTPAARNDSFETPQIVGSYYSKSRKRGGQWTLDGIINNGPNFDDGVDYYGVPMLAGQTMAVTLNSGGITTLAIIDPDGRVVATDLSNLNGDDFLNQMLTVKADRPGLWRVEVIASDPTQLVDIDRIYALTVDKIGEMAIGGIAATGNVQFNRNNLGARVRTNDLGAVLAGDRIEGVGTTSQTGRNQTFLNAIETQAGNIRALEAGNSIGRLENGVYSLFPNVASPRGSVGLITAPEFVFFNATALAPSTGEPVPAATVGGDYQVIQTDGDLSGVIAANGNIGVIRAGSWASTIIDLPGYISVNADGVGTGELGLIDIQGDFGTSNYGGPAISHGDGGNVRYLRVGGQAYRPFGRGSGGLNVLTARDEVLDVVDDSGATVTITPYNGLTTNGTVNEGGTTTTGNGIPDPFGGNGNTSSTGSNGIPSPFGGSNGNGLGSSIPSPFGGQTPAGAIPTVPTTDIVGVLSVFTYPLVNGGGSIIYRIDSTTGVVISSGRRGGGGSGDIGQLNINATSGVGIINPTSNNDLATVRPSQQQTLSLGSGTTLDAIFTGGTVNVFQMGSTASALLDFSRIVNNTNGEIVNMTVGDVGYLSAQSIGVARPVNGVRIEGLADATDTRFSGFGALPIFNQLRNGIFLDSAIDIRSRGAIGNIFFTGTVQNISANSDRVNDRSIFEGVAAPIVQIGNNPTRFGGLRRLDVGEGLADTGSGDVAFSGLYITGALGLISNDNGGGDIRGDIIAGRYFEGIRLSGTGSILNADIFQVSNLSTGTVGLFGLGTEQAELSAFNVTPAGSRTTLDGIGEIRITGNGGVLNTRVLGYNVGRITVADSGFGVLNSQVRSSSGGSMAGMSVGGLGIRNTEYTGGSTIGDVVATGKGSLVDVRNLSISARPRDSGYFDPFTGVAPNASTDLNLLLGTSAKLPKIEGVTNSGVIQDSQIAALRSINSVKAFEIRGVNTLGARPRDDIYPMQINASNSIGTIQAGRNINGLHVNAGNLTLLAAGRDILQFQLESNGTVKAIKAGRNVLGSADFIISGTGSVGLFSAGGNVNGTMFAARGIGSIVVGGNLGSAKSQGGMRSGTNINLLQIGGNLASNAYIRAFRTIRSIVIKGDVQDNATIRATSFGTQKIDGTILGDIING